MFQIKCLQMYTPYSKHLFRPCIRIMSLCITQVSVEECFYLCPWSWMPALVAFQIPSRLRLEIAVSKLGGLWFLAVLSRLGHALQQTKRYLLLQGMRVIVLEVTHTASV